MQTCMGPQMKMDNKESGMTSAAFVRTSAQLFFARSPFEAASSFKRVNL